MTCQKLRFGIGGGGEGGALRGQNRSAAMSARPMSTQMRSKAGIACALAPLSTRADGCSFVRASLTEELETGHEPFLSRDWMLDSMCASITLRSC